VRTANTITVNLRLLTAVPSDLLAPDAWKGSYAIFAAQGNFSTKRRKWDSTPRHLPRPQLQLIKFRHESLHSILSNFDLDICSFAFNGKNVYALDRAREALTAGRISAPLEHRVWRTYDRLLKYCCRGFSIHIPDLHFIVDSAELLAEGRIVVIGMFLMLL